MGSGVLPLAMATRPAKAPCDPVRGSAPLVERAPRGLQPTDLIGGLKGGAHLAGDGAGRSELRGGVCCKEDLPPDGPRLSPRIKVRGLKAHGGTHSADEIARQSRASWCLPLDADAQADRAISTGQLRGLPRFHLRPIDVVVYHGSRRDLVLRRVSRLDAFSGYPVRT